MSINPIITTKSLSYRYGAETVLENVDLTIRPGEFVALVGPNGSGKTTLLKIILGLLTPTQGRVELFGQKMQLGKFASRIGYIPQKVAQNESRFPITVEEVVELGQNRTRRTKNAVEQALKMVELWPQRHKLLSDLSGGQQQRAFIAKALVSEPELLILDEPTVGIDAKSQETFYALLEKLNTEKHLTILIVSHDIDVVMSQVDSVLCLNRNVVYHGSTTDFVQGKYLEKLYGENRRFIVHHHHEH